MIQTEIKAIPEGAFNYIATRNFKHKKHHNSFMELMESTKRNVRFFSYPEIFCKAREVRSGEDMCAHKVGSHLETRIQPGICELVLCTFQFLTSVYFVL